MSDLSKLRNLAAKATPGVWEVDDNRPFSRDLQGIFSPEQKRYVIKIDYDEQPKNRKDAEFIAAANPSAVLALLDRLHFAERENEKHRADLKEWEEHGAPAWIDAKQELIDEQRARAEAAEAKIAAVEALHFQYRGPGDHDICPVDERLWPCPTVRALQESEGK